MLVYNPFNIVFYTKQYEQIKTELEKLICKLKRMPENCQDGHVNFVLTTIVDRVYQPRSYKVFNRAIGVLSCIMQEFYRRVVSPYEDKKREQNGDVYDK